ncbi:hypothetical protein [Microcoleus sp. EPA2]
MWQKPGFLDFGGVGGEVETGFLSLILVGMRRLWQKPGFLEFGAIGGG